MAKMPKAAENGRRAGGRQLRPIVLKFGGTSVEDSAALRRVIAIVSRRRHDGVVVVVSALAGVTDQLLIAGEHAARGHLAKAQNILQGVRERHRAAAGDLFSDASSGFSPYLESECEAAAGLLQGIAALGEFSSRTADRLVSTGELLSSRLLTQALQAAGSKATWVDTRECIVTDDAHGAAVPLREETERRLRQVLAPLLQNGDLPVLGGFIAATREGTPTT